MSVSLSGFPSMITFCIMEYHIANAVEEVSSWGSSFDGPSSSSLAFSGRETYPRPSAHPQTSHAGSMREDCLIGLLVGWSIT